MYDTCAHKGRYAFYCSGTLVVYINKQIICNKQIVHSQIANMGQELAKAQQLVMTHKYRGSQQSSRKVKPKFIDSTQGEPKDIYKP
jgi:hypothetical protein